MVERDPLSAVCPGHLWLQVDHTKWTDQVDRNKWTALSESRLVVHSPLAAVCHLTLSVGSASEQRGSNSECLQGFCLEANARIWP